MGAFCFSTALLVARAVLAMDLLASCRGWSADSAIELFAAALFDTAELSVFGLGEGTPTLGKCARSAEIRMASVFTILILGEVLRSSVGIVSKDARLAMDGGAWTYRDELTVWSLLRG